ncbi:MAG: DNA repair protein RecN [Desulfobacteraceae bacterium]|nr:MAG: DNA repair protein RecN [Desulfobacteraceae bacterium]
MLQELSIRNFAIIEDLSIRFGKGLTILSGETGAGKSIIINAVNLLLGSRVSSALIRTGAESAELEAFFDLPADSSVATRMAAQGHDSSEGLLVRRIISANERHRIYINGRMATMQALSELTTHLASISGQHAHQGLLKEEEHLFILDQFGDLPGLRSQYAQAYARLLPLIRKERELLEQLARRGEQLELLRFQQGEIEACAPLSGEDVDLEKERLRLKNGENLFQTVQQCIDGLYGADDAVFERLGYLSKELTRVGRLDERLAAGAAELDEITYRTEDLASRLRDYLKQIDLDPHRLETVEQRLDALNRLKRKYGAGSLEGVRSFAEDISRRLQEIEVLEEDIARVRVELENEHLNVCRLADELSAGRRESARRLASKVEKELAHLKMEGTRVIVEIRPVLPGKETDPHLVCHGQALTDTGVDRAVFMIAPNVGEALKPLAAIASGGELSRIVLALKAILAHNDALETVVFDEVDAGIGGSVADVVGKKLAALARQRQVLCITHLPQIAKYGDHHFRILKSVVKGRTQTTIVALNPEERVEEIARMLGGETITATTLSHAREMLTAERSF